MTAVERGERRWTKRLHAEADPRDAAVSQDVYLVRRDRFGSRFKAAFAVRRPRVGAVDHHEQSVELPPCQLGRRAAADEYSRDRSWVAGHLAFERVEVAAGVGIAASDDGEVAV